MGVKKATTSFPISTMVFTKYLKQLAPDFKFNAVAVNVDIQTQEHKDVHNVGRSLIAALSSFSGGELLVEGSDGRRKIPVTHKASYFEPHETHSTAPWKNGHRMVVVGYSVRDSGKLSAENVATLRHHGFDWDPHCRSVESPSTLSLSTLRVKLLDATEKRDLPQAPTTEEHDLPQAPATEKRDLPQAPTTEKRDLPQAPTTEERDLPQAPATAERDLPQASVALGELGALHVNQDLELAIQDMEDRASRLRDLIEQEEIMSEEYRRMSEESREHLLGARDQVASFLDEVHTSLVELERLRTTACLKAMTASSPSSTTSQVEEVDYEAMLDALEEDLKVVHTVPLVQVKDALDRWVEAIKKEVQMLFQTGTLRRVTHGEIKELEQSGKVMMAPAKCVFTLKPPSISGRRARRKCRIVICGNYVPAGSSDISLYASGASTDALRVALVLSSFNNWLGAVSDIASAFLLAPWPKDLPPMPSVHQRS